MRKRIAALMVSITNDIKDLEWQWVWTLGDSDGSEMLASLLEAQLLIQKARDELEKRELEGFKDWRSE